MATDTRDRMIRSTARLLRRQGYHGTGLNQIVAEAEAPKGSLYFHFPGGKAQLAAEAVELFGANVGRLLQAELEHGTVADAVCGYLDQVADGFDERGVLDGCAVGIVAAEAAPLEPTLGEATARVLDGWVELLAEHLVTEGREPTEAHGLAATAIAVIEGAILLARGTGSSSPVREVRDTVRRLLDPPPAT